MNIVHIASGRGGGAKIAALRLARLQATLGHNVSLISNYPDFSSNNMIQVEVPREIKGKIFSFIQHKLVSGQYDFVSTLSNNVLDENLIKDMNPTIVHFHNWFNISNLEAISKISNSYPTVMTLHDMRIMTGGCHNSLQCNGYLSECSNCPASKLLSRAIRKSKKNSDIFNKMEEKIQKISPSEWLKNKYLEVYPNQIEHISTIPNAIEETYFSKSSKVKPENNKEFRIIFCASQPDAPIKGLNQLISAAQIFAEENEKSFKVTIHIVGKIGNTNDKMKGVEVIWHGELEPSRIISLICEMNLGVIASTEENSPSVITEYQLQNLPVLASRVGGIPELIEDGVTGLLCESGFESILNGLRRFTMLTGESVKEMTEKAIQAASVRNDPAVIIGRHFEIYSRALSERKK